MIETTISTAKKMIRQMVQVNLNKLINGEKVKNAPIFLHSSPGVGKSAVTDQVSDEMREFLIAQSVANDFGFVDVRLGTMDAAEVQGMPHVVGHGQDDAQMRFSVPDWFPSQAKVDAGLIPKYGIVFFDELANAPIDTQHAAYRVIHDRGLHGATKMAEGYQIMAAGNLKEDKTGAKMVAPALANRFATHLKIMPNLVDFTGYALAVGIKPSIIGFLNYKSDNLYKFDPKKNDVAFATPRSWEAANNLLEVYGDDQTMLTIALSGCIGQAVTADFMQYLKYEAQLPDFQKIMAGESDFEVTSDMDMGLMFALTTSTITHLVENAQDKVKVQNLNKAILSKLGDDFKVLVYKSLKSMGNERATAQVVLATLETYKGIAKYTKRG